MKLTKEKIKAVYENGLVEEVKYPLSELEDIEYLINQIEQNYNLIFGVYVRGSSDGMDFWLQAEYWSKKLKKTIIWDYDWNSNFENEDELIEVINNTSKEIKDFESRLSIKE